MTLCTLRVRRAPHLTAPRLTHCPDHKPRRFLRFFFPSTASPLSGPATVFALPLKYILTPPFAIATSSTITWFQTPRPLTWVSRTASELAACGWSCFPRSISHRASWVVLLNTKSGYTPPKLKPFSGSYRSKQAALHMIWVLTPGPSILPFSVFFLEFRPHLPAISQPRQTHCCPVIEHSKLSPPGTFFPPHHHKTGSLASSDEPPWLLLQSSTPASPRCAAHHCLGFAVFTAFITT